MENDNMEIDNQTINSQQMHLDEEAIRALDLVESKRAMYRTGKSLYSVLNRCKTAGGKLLLEEWIQHPLTDIDGINRRLDIVEFLTTNHQLKDDIGDCFSRLPDLKKLTHKLSSKKCNLMDCCKIYQSIIFINALTDILKSHKNDLINEEFVIKLEDMQNKCRNFSKLIDETVDKESLERGDPLIDARYDETLAGYSEQMANVKQKAEKFFSRTANELDLDDKSIKLETCPSNGYVCRVTLKKEGAIRGQNKYQKLGTKKDGVRFTTDELTRCSSKYLDIRGEYEEIQKTIFDKILDTLKTYCKPLDCLIEILSNLDVFYSLADAANYSSLSYVRPKMLPKGTGKIKLTNLRHPCVENQINVYYIPNSIDFDEEDKKFFIVTGPNMGGKSTFLRSIGIAVLLAQMGSFVPAEEAEISIVDAIFTRIGASDKQFKGVSTFKAEMLETAEILKNASEDSLVIIDELGRGTSTFDGFGLAYSISKEIAINIKSYCLFATHFHEVTSLAKEVSTVDNLFVNYQFDDKDRSLKMLYQVEKGVCDQKFGIHVAKMVPFPDEMIEFAQDKVKKYEQVENPPNKELLDKISGLIKEKSSVLKELNDNQLLAELKKIVSEAQ